MQRRQFLKNTLAAGAAAIGGGSLLSAIGCSNGATNESMNSSPLTEGFNFDEVIDRSGTNSIKLRRAESLGPGRLPMWIADMDFRTAPFIVDDIRARLDKDVFGYTYIPDSYYESIQSWEERRHGYRPERDWLLFIPGVIAGLAFAIDALTEKGDRIVVQPPVYDPFKNKVEQLGRVAVDNPMIWKDGRYDMDFEGLERIMREQKPRGLVLCNPHNPAGIVWPRETLKQLADICARNNCIVFVDEIHADLALPGHEHVPFCTLGDEAAQNCVMLLSPTKAFNLAGFITAHAVIPNESLRKPLEEYMRARKLDEAHLLAPLLTESAYTHPTTWLEEVVQYIQGNVDLLMTYFRDNIPSITPLAPEASFLVWLDCTALGKSQDELMDLFNNQAKVVVNNGAPYGPGGEGHVRINVACPRSVLQEALERISNVVA